MKKIKMESKIFTEAEQDFLEKRLKGEKNWDITGIFSSRIKPKIRELIDYWFPKRKELKKLLIKIKKNKTKKKT